MVGHFNCVVKHGVLPPHNDGDETSLGSKCRIMPGTLFRSRVANIHVLVLRYNSSMLRQQRDVPGALSVRATCSSKPVSRQTGSRPS